MMQNTTFFSTLLLLLTLLTACAEFQQGLQNQGLQKNLVPSQKIPLPPPPTSPGMTLGEGLNTGISVGKAVPFWTTAWAATPNGITLTNVNNNVFDTTINNQLIVSITGYDLIWSKLYYPDVNYILSQIANAQNGKQINQLSITDIQNTNVQLTSTNVWRSQIDIPDQNGQVSTTGHWIQLPNQQTTLTVNVPASNFIINPARFNAIAIYACKKLPITTADQTGNYFEYDCNNIEGTTPNTVKVKSDGTGLVLGSGTGAWLLQDFNIACNNPCTTSGQTQCLTGSAHKETCTGPDTNGCYTWSTATQCTNGPCNSAQTDCCNNQCQTPGITCTNGILNTCTTLTSTGCNTLASTPCASQICASTTACTTTSTLPPAPKTPGQ